MAFVSSLSGITKEAQLLRASSENMLLSLTYGSQDSILSTAD